MACTHSLASAATTLWVVGANGPSSNVSTTSLSLSGNVVGNCFSPTRGVSATPTLRMRDVPKTSLYGQSAPPAEVTAADPSNNAVISDGPTDARYLRLRRPNPWTHLIGYLAPAFGAPPIVGFAIG